MELVSYVPLLSSDCEHRANEDQDNGRGRDEREVAAVGASGESSNSSSVT